MSGTRDVHPLTHCINLMAQQPSKSKDEVESILSRTLASMKESREPAAIEESTFFAALATCNSHAVSWLVTRSKHPNLFLPKGILSEGIKRFLAYEDCYAKDTMTHESKDDTVVLEKRKVIDVLIELIDSRDQFGHPFLSVNVDHAEIAVKHKNYYLFERLACLHPYIFLNYFNYLSGKNLFNLPYVIKFIRFEKNHFQGESFTYALNQLLLNNDVSNAIDFIERGVQISKKTMDIMLDQANKLGISIPELLKLIECLLTKDRRWIEYDWKKVLRLQNSEVFKAIIKLGWRIVKKHYDIVPPPWVSIVKAALELYQQGDISLLFCKDIISQVPLIPVTTLQTFHLLWNVVNDTQDLLIEIGNVDLVRSLKCGKQIATEPNLLKAVTLGHQELVDELTAHHGTYNKLQKFVVGTRFLRNIREERLCCAALVKGIELGNLNVVKCLLKKGAHYDEYSLYMARWDYKETNEDRANQRKRIRFFISTLIHIRNGDLPSATNDCSNLKKEDQVDLFNLFKSTDKEPFLKQVLGSDFSVQHSSAEAKQCEPKQILLLDGQPNWHLSDDGKECPGDSKSILGAQAVGDTYTKLAVSDKSRPEPGLTVTQPSSGNLGIFVKQPTDEERVSFSSALSTIQRLTKLAFEDRPEVQQMILKACKAREEELALLSTSVSVGRTPIRS